MTSKSELTYRGESTKKNSSNSLESSHTPGTFSLIWNSLTPRWREWWIRLVLGLTMLFMLCLMLYSGPFGIIITVFIIQFKCYQEIVAISYRKYKQQNLPENIPLFRSLNCYFILVVSYFSSGIILQFYVAPLVDNNYILSILKKYHILISFILYMIGFISFVLTLKKGFYKIQFKLYGWSHLAIVILVTQGYFLIVNTFKGLFWFIVTVIIVVCNDITAYFFGFFFGKTALTKLSPKKTWEGFIGALFSTLIFSFLIPFALCPFKNIVCPFEYSLESLQFETICEPLEIFILYEYKFNILPFSFYFYPCQFHMLIFATFASVIAPFGGLFASGFKRAFQLKDFDSVIPGHGGFLDRFDCQLVMASFAYVYVYTFISQYDTQKLIQSILGLPVDQQILIYNAIHNHLIKSNNVNL